MASGTGSPSAPPEEHSPVNIDPTPTPAHTVVPPYPTIPPVMEVSLGAPAPVSTYPYSQPPPSYQDALSYPATSYQNSGPGSAMPKLDTAHIPPYNPLPPASQQYPVSPPINPPQPVVVSVQSAPIGNCSYCRIGTIMTETDLCCLICLIVLAIFTFPLGLLFLCCIPCTAHRRCSNCRRVG